MAAFCHLGLLKFTFLTVGAILHQCNKFCDDPSNRSGDKYRGFCDFQDSGRRHLGFSKIRNFNGRFAVRGQYASKRQISSKSARQTVAEIWRFNGIFQNGGRPPSWIRSARIGVTDVEYLLVSIILQNFVEIDAVVSII